MAAAAELKLKTWTPAVSFKFQDNIVSSEHANKKPFVPSYEKDRRPCMELLLTNEYQRIWWREKRAWDKAQATKTTTKQLLPRMIIKKKTRTPPTDKFAANATRKRKEKAKKAPVKVSNEEKKKEEDEEEEKKKEEEKEETKENAQSEKQEKIVD